MRCMGSLKTLSGWVSFADDDMSEAYANLCSFDTGNVKVKGLADCSNAVVILQRRVNGWSIFFAVVF